MNRLLRLLGAVLAIVLPLATRWLDLHPGVGGAVVGFALLGFVVGTLWRFWWSLAYLAGLGLARYIYVLTVPEGRRSGPLVLALAGVVLGAAPALLGAAGGTVAGVRISRLIRTPAS